MIYCNHCGKKLEDGAVFCPSCGTAVPAASCSTDTVSVSGDAEKNKLFAVLSYFGFLVFVTICSAPRSRFARFHANQGLVLFLADLICGISGLILHAVLSLISWRLFFISSLWNLIWIPLTVLSFIGIANAAQGQEKELPFIGKIRILK